MIRAFQFVFEEEIRGPANDTLGQKKDTRLISVACLEAGEGARTLDIQLGRLTLYQLSYTRMEP